MTIDTQGWPAECCGLPTARKRTVVLVAAMINPPRTTDRWALAWSWQCLVTEDHQGKSQATTDCLEDSATLQYATDGATTKDGIR